MTRTTWLVAGIVLVVLFTVYALSGERSEGPRDKLVQLVLLVPAAGCLAWFVSGKVRGDLAARALDSIDRPRTHLFLAVLCLAVFIFCAWVAFGPLEGIAKGNDEFTGYFQAKIFARGVLAAPVPQVEDPGRFFFSRSLVMERGMWFGQYTPTHSLLMAPLVSLGLSGLLGPLEGVMSIIGLYLLIRLWAGERKARIAAILLCISPFFLLMTASHMAHNSNLMFVTWALYFLSIHWKDGKFVHALVSGLLLGLALTTKPYPVTAWSIFLFFLLVFRGRKGLKAILGLVLGGILPLAGLLATNLYYTGSPFRMPYQLARSGRLLGFGVDKAWYPVFGDYDHTVWRALKNMAHQAAVGSVSIFGWPMLSLVPMAFSLAEFRRDRRVIWLFSPIILIAAMLMLHAWPGVIYGPRHYYTFLPVIIALSMIGFRYLLRKARARWDDRGGSFTILSVAGLFAITLVIYIPEELRWKTGPWLNIDSRPIELAESLAEPPALVFMEVGSHGYPSLLSGLTFTSPFMDGDYIFCGHQTPSEDMEMMAAFPDRSAWLFWWDGEESHMRPWSPELAQQLEPAGEFEVRPVPDGE